MRLGELVEIFGGRGEVQKISAWGAFYAAKWWTVLGGTGSSFFKALSAALAHAGLLEGGDIRKTLQRPNTPLNSYVAEHVEFLESVDRVGVKSIDSNTADRNSLEIIYSGLQLQSWRLSVARWLLKQATYSTLLEPYPEDGILAHIAIFELGVRYRGYGPRLDLARVVAPSGEFAKAVSVCEIGIRADSVLLFEKLQRFTDPVRELQCLYSRLEQGGVVLVAEPDAALSPAYAASQSIFGALIVATRKQISKFLAVAGFKPEAEANFPPYYLSVWRKPARRSLTPSERWME